MAIGLLFLILGLVIPATAQVARPALPQNQDLIAAQDHYRHGRYRLAAASARKALYRNLHQSTLRVQDIEDAQYFLAKAMLREGAVGAVDTARILLASITQPAYKDRISLAIAQHFFKKGALEMAIPYYESAGIANLSNDEIADAKFELAYCYFTLNRFAEAAPRFAAIRDLPNDKYYASGNYYYGLLAYNQANYAAATKSFERIKDLPQYRRIVPYYIAELRYFNGDHSGALALAKELIAAPEKNFYHNELHQLAGQVLFEEGKYAEALPYFETYQAAAERPRPEETYELAYTYYKLGRCEKATPLLKNLSGQQDSLGQTAMYLLGDCALKIGDKRAARSAFALCSGLGYNPALREAALLLNGKLAFEAGLYDEATASINSLLRDFPNSKYADEARTLRADLYVRSADFAAAFAALQGVSATTPGYAKAYQRAAYGLAAMQLQEGKLKAADSLYQLSRDQPNDKALSAASYFWQAEIAYRQARFTDAVNLGTSYIQLYQPGMAMGDAQPAQAYMTLGFANMGAKNYQAAQRAFAKARELASGRLATDARLRQADAAMMAKDISTATSLYQQAGSGTDDNARYARLQQASLMGLSNKPDEQRALLTGLANTAGAYRDEASLELAGLELESGNYAAALNALAPLRDTTGKQTLAGRAWLKTGQAYTQQDQSTNAEQAFLLVLRRFPGTPEAAEALQELKELYIETGKPEAYAQTRNRLGLPPAGDGDLDSAYYAAAERKYAAGDAPGAVLAMQQYLTSFPDGMFTLKASYYLAESQAQRGRTDSALFYYDRVLAYPANDFSLSAAQHAAQLAAAQNKPEAALRYWGIVASSAQDATMLTQAAAGQMRANLAIGDTTAALQQATALQAMSDVARPDLELGQLLIARNYPTDTAAANTIWRGLSTSTDRAIAAEARWRLAATAYEAGRLDEAEAAAVANARQSAGQEYWVVKSYLLLADILTTRGDLFNARATLQSIIKNAKLPQLVAEAQSRLATLDQSQQKTK